MLNQPLQPHVFRSTTRSRSPIPYTAPAWSDSVIMTTKPGLSFPLGPIHVDVLRNAELDHTAELFVDDVLSGHWMTQIGRLNLHKNWCLLDAWRTRID